MAEIINIQVNNTAASVSVQMTGGFVIGSQITQQTIEGVIGQAVVQGEGIEVGFNVGTGKTTITFAAALKAKLDSITAIFTTALKTSYDSAVTNAHTHANKTILDNTTASYVEADKTELTTATSVNNTQNTRLDLAELKLANMFKAVGVTMSYNNRVIAAGGTVEGLNNVMEKYLAIIIL